LGYELDPAPEPKALGPELAQKSRVTPPAADPLLWVRLKAASSPSKPPLPWPAMVGKINATKVEETNGSRGGDLSCVEQGREGGEHDGGGGKERERGERRGGRCALRVGECG